MLPFIILYTNQDFNVPEAWACEADDVEHAEEQFENAEPDAVITWIVQTDDVCEAYDTYHRESTMED